MAQTRDIQAALHTFRQHGGLMKTSQALERGIHPAALYRLVEDGQLLRLARGLYRLASIQEFRHPDLAVVAVKAQEAVVCLISALTFHGITTQVPRMIYLAVARGRYAGLRLRTPPVWVCRFDDRTFEEGIETRPIDGITVRIYGIARTIVDCFKYRHKLGVDVAIEALRVARARKRISDREILYFAQLLRQDRVMAPYLESFS